MRTCAKCGQGKDVGEFYVCGGRTASSCKECDRASARTRMSARRATGEAQEYMARWRADNADKVRAASRVWRAANAASVRGAGRTYYAKNAQSLRERVRRYATRVQPAITANKRARYQTNPDYRQRTRARNVLYDAVKAGRLARPETCRKCGSSNRRIEAHHPDYSRPLDVQWLCSSCHGATRRKQA